MDNLVFLVFALMLAGGAYHFCRVVGARKRNESGEHGGGIDHAPTDSLD